MNQPKKRGRPKKSSQELQTAYLDMRITEAEKKAFKEAAELSGLSLTGWIRERLRSASRRELIESGKQVPFLQTNIPE
jgi:uncharacterized protein (DUF1778 family)